MNYKMLRGASILLPFLAIAFTVAIYFMTRRAVPTDPISEDLIPVIALSAIALFLCLVGIIFFVVYDIIHVIKRRSLSPGTKVAWAFAILLLNLFSIPVYGMMHFREDERHAYD